MRRGDPRPLVSRGVRKAGDAGTAKIRRLNGDGAVRLLFVRVSKHVDTLRNRLVPPDRCPTRTRSRRNP